jgi:hypothetical protein
VRKEKRLVAALAVLAALLPLTTGCAVGRGEPLVVGEMVTETQSFEVDGARSLEVDLSVNLGSLRLSGGSEGLADMEFTYNVAEWKPKVDRSERGDRAHLTIEQPDLQDRSIPDDAESRWNVKLNSDVPVTLNLDVGIGESVIALGGTSATSVTIDQGIGEITLDLTGDWANDLEVSIDGGIGTATIRVPEEVGVRVRADAGIGSVSAFGFTRRGDAYVNGSYGETEATIDIAIDAGIGNITIQVGNEATAQI